MDAPELSISAAARTDGDRPFLVEHDGATSTFRELAGEVHARAAILSLAAGELVGLVGTPTRATLIDLLVLLELGVPFVALHPRWAPDERARVLRDAGVARVLEDGVLVPTPATSPSPISSMARGATLAVLYTSGTTGRPRGAVLSRQAFLGAARASASRLGWRDDDRWLLAMPLAHVGGLSVLVRCLAARRTVVLGPPGPFDPAATLESVARHRVTLLSLVPTQLARLVALGAREPVDAQRPAHVRAVLLGGAACPGPVLERAAALGWPLRTTYGLTEMCSQVTTSLEPVRSSADGAGTPLDGVEIRIREGRIHVRSPFAMDGWLDPGLQRHGAPSPFDADGFYDTGDLGELDAEGRLHVHVRRDDLVVTGGENVYPAEVEEALLAIDGIEAACVVGLPDELWGQRVAAALVCAPSAPDDAVILAALRERLAAFKTPRAIVRVEALPTNAVGKLDRRAVRALFEPAS
jgi:O-succinylbenzoic acid--CoA ligase